MSDFFKNDAGQYSMMRLLSFIVVVALTPAIYVYPEQSPTICLLIGAVVGAKGYQKQCELKE